MGSMQKLVSLFPRGDYKLIFKMYTENDEIVGVVNVIATVNSTIIDTFG